MDPTIFFDFINSGFHSSEKSSIKDVYAVTTVIRDYATSSELNFVVKNNDRNHAEEIMIQLLTVKLIECKTKWHVNILMLDVELLINFSPCAQRCSRALVQFKMDMEKINIILSPFRVVFPHLYKVRRPSCIERGCKHRIVSQEEHNESITALLNMERVGIILTTFNDNYWMKLASYCGLTYKSQEDRQLEDVNLQSDLLQCLAEAEFIAAQGPASSSTIDQPSIATTRSMAVRGRGFNAISPSLPSANTVSNPGRGGSNLRSNGLVVYPARQPGPQYEHQQQPRCEDDPEKVSLLSLGIPLLGRNGAAMEPPNPNLGHGNAAPRQYASFQGRHNNGGQANRSIFPH